MPQSMSVPWLVVLTQGITREDMAVTMSKIKLEYPLGIPSTNETMPGIPKTEDVAGTTLFVS